MSTPATADRDGTCLPAAASTLLFQTGLTTADRDGPQSASFEQVKSFAPGSPMHNSAAKQQVFDLPMSDDQLEDTFNAMRFQNFVFENTMDFRQVLRSRQLSTMTTAAGTAQLPSCSQRAEDCMSKIDT